MLDLDERFDSATHELHDLIETITVAPASRVTRRHRRRRRATAVVAIMIAGFGVVAIAGIASRDDKASIAPGSTPDSHATPPVTAVDTTNPLRGVAEAPTASSPSVTTHEVSGDIGPMTYALDVVAGVGEERSDTLVGVPAIFRVDVTNLVLHNPYGDDGTAELLLNGDVLYQWDVGAMNAREEVQPGTSALVFDGSDTITLVLRCEGTTKVDRTECQISLSLIGEAVLVG